MVVYLELSSLLNPKFQTDVLRAVAVMIKQEGLSLNDVASGIRIKIFLEQMGSSEIEMERLLTDIDIHSFKTNQTFSDFVKKVHFYSPSL